MNRISLLIGWLILVFFIMDLPAQDGEPKAYSLTIRSGFNTAQNIQVNEGDTLLFQASGRIIVGAFAGACGPEGSSNSFLMAYNVVSGARHGSLIGKIGDGNRWTYLGREKRIIATQTGVLHLLVNDREPGNNSGSFSVKLVVKPKLSKIIIGDIEGEPVWITSDFETDQAVHFGEMTFSAYPDKKWYLKSEEDGLVVGIVKEDEPSRPKLMVNDTRFRRILTHINRNQLNREAKGELTYLCSTPEQDVNWTYDLAGTFKSCGDFVYRLYKDENNCVWVMALACESVYHPDPTDEDREGLKFLRMHPTSNASFESIRIPRRGSNENAQSLSITGTRYTIKDDYGLVHHSVNLRHSDSRGTYNFTNSIFATNSQARYSLHKAQDVDLHNDDYVGYAIFFPERYGNALPEEIQFIKDVEAIPLQNNLRECPVIPFPWR